MSYGCGSVRGQSDEAHERSPRSRPRRRHLRSRPRSSSEIRTRLACPLSLPRDVFYAAVGVVRVLGACPASPRKKAPAQGKGRHRIEARRRGRARTDTALRRTGMVIVPNVNILAAFAGGKQAIKRKPLERNSLGPIRVVARTSALCMFQLSVASMVTPRVARSDTTFGHCQEGSGLAAARTYDAETIRREFSVKFQYVSAYSVACARRAQVLAGRMNYRRRSPSYQAMNASSTKPLGRDLPIFDW